MAFTFNYRCFHRGVCTCPISYQLYFLSSVMLDINNMVNSDILRTGLRWSFGVITSISKCAVCTNMEAFNRNCKSKLYFLSSIILAISNHQQQQGQTFLEPAWGVVLVWWVVTSANECIICTNVAKINRNYHFEPACMRTTTRIGI